MTCLRTISAFSVISCAITPAAWCQCSPQRLVHPTPAYYQRLGDAVAITDDACAAASHWGDVGSNVQAGFVRMYARGIFGGWSYVHTITAPDAAVGDHFGSAIDMAGDYILVGAPARNQSSPELESSGAAYLYRRENTSWWLVQRMDPLNAYEYAAFGSAVAISGELAAVGVPGHPTSGPHSGLVEIWEKNANPTFSRTARLFLGNAEQDDEFGAAVDVAEGGFLVPDRVFVGAPGRDGPVDGDSGVVLVFTRTGNTWSTPITLAGSDVTAYQNFGETLAASSMRVAVGAPDHSPDGVASAGAVYIFETNIQGQTWTQVTKLTAPTPTAVGHFGRSVAIGSDDRVVVGCAHPQRTYVFRRTPGGTWAIEYELADPDGSLIGADVAIAGNSLIAGDPAYDSGDIQTVGSALTFTIGSGASDMAVFAPTVGPGTYYGCTTSATNDGSTTCGGSNASRDVWYRFAPPCSGEFTIDTIGADFDTVLSVHTGSTGTSANSLACNDDRGIGLESSRITMNMIELGTYLIRVSGSGPEAGEFTLNISSCQPLCPCDWNADHAINSQDFFDFLAAFFANSADFNTDGVTNSQDFFDFLACFFKGC